VSKTIAVLRGLTIVVDDGDYPPVSQDHRTPELRKKGGRHFYVAVQSRVKFYLHRLITKVTDGRRVLFKDGNGLKCQMESD